MRTVGGGAASLLYSDGMLTKNFRDSLYYLSILSCIVLTNLNSTRIWTVGSKSERLGDQLNEDHDAKLL